MKKDVVLQSAMDAVKARGQDYGTVLENHQRIADLWSVILGKEVTPTEAILCMTALKIARLMETPDHEDSWIDIAGYAACGGQMIDDQRELDLK